MSAATFVLVPGAGGQAWYWHLVVPELRRLGHHAVPVDLPAGDETAGLREYTDAVVAAIGDRTGPLVVVGASLGGFTAPLVCARLPVALLVLVNAMIPAPGETAGDWWANTGYQDHPFDALRDFFHDVPPEVTAEALAGGEPPQAGRPFEDPWPLPAWPDVPTRVLAGRDERFFPLEFQRRVARERLRLPVDEMTGGHLVALSQPVELARRLAGYWATPR